MFFSTGIDIALGILVLAIVVILNSVYLVKQAQAVIIERLGKYHRTLGPGIHLVVPFIDQKRELEWTYFKEIGQNRHYRNLQRMSYLDLRETVYDFPKQDVITKDNVTIEISALLYFQITDPKAAMYEACNVPEAIEKLTHSTLRNLIGSMDLDETLVSRDQINGKLRLVLDEASDKWGVKVNRVELQEVNPPANIRTAMEKQMRAERDRRAAILEAEGLKQAAILEAEGKKEAQVLYAQGEAEARITTAEADARARIALAEAEHQSIALVQQALSAEEASRYLIAQQYLKTLPLVTQGADKTVVIPYEATATLGSLTSIATLFDQAQKSNK